VREAALKRSVTLASPELLPVIVGRLNDWVPQVRQAARSALLTLLPFIPAAHWLTVLPSLEQLRRARRDDHAEWLDTFERSLLTWITKDDLVEAHGNGDIRMARACLRLLVQHEVLDPTALMALAMSSRHDIVLSLQAAKLCAGLPKDRQLDACLMAMRSHFGAVRAIAVAALLAPDSEANKPDIAMNALFDVQSSVRSHAIAWLVSQGTDVRGLYRAALEHDLTLKRAKIALISLAGFRHPEDLPTFKANAEDPRLSVRLVAFTSWYKVVNAERDQIALLALGDVAPKVRKYAYDLVCKHGAFIAFPVVRDILVERGDLALLEMFESSGVLSPRLIR
jgi:hypothetical protein